MKKIICIAASLFLVLFVFIIFEFNSSCSLDNSFDEVVEKYNLSDIFIGGLAAKNKSEADTQKIMNECTKIKSDTNDSFTAVLYGQKDNHMLVIFQKSWLPNRYTYYGASIGTSPISDYQLYQAGKKLIIVYGDNRTIKATNYNLMYGESVLKSETDLDEYILDIHIIDSKDELLTTEFYRGENKINLH